MASTTKNLITVDQLDDYPDDGNRYEIIEGELFVSRAPGIPHQLVLHNLLMAIGEYLNHNRIGKIVPGAGAVFSDYDAVIPDIAFVRNERWDEVVAGERFIKAPNLVIEIVSPGNANRLRDLTAKRELYGKYGVEEYWIVDPDNQAVTVYRLRENTLEQNICFTGDEGLTSLLLPDFRLRVSAIFNL